MFLEGKKFLICGLANKRSIAAGIAKSMTEQGAQLAFSYQSERLKRNVESIANDLGHDILIECCLLYTSPSPRDAESSRMPSSA